MQAWSNLSILRRNKVSKDEGQEIQLHIYLEDGLNKLRLGGLGNTSRYDWSLISEGRGGEGGQTVNWPPDDNLSCSGLLLNLLLRHINSLRCEDLRQWADLQLEASGGREDCQVWEISRVARPARPGVAVASELDWEPEAKPGLENIQGSSDWVERRREEAEILDHRVSLAQAGHQGHYQGRQQLERIINFLKLEFYIKIL